MTSFLPFLKLSSTKEIKGCLMLMLPPAACEELRKWKAKNIPKDVVVEDEDEFHTTVIYGTPEKVKTSDLLGMIPSGKLSIKATTLKRFPASEMRPESDVIVLAVTDCDELRELHKAIAAKYDVKTNYAYNPHITLAYVKPGALSELTGEDAKTVIDDKIVCDTMIFSKGEVGKKDKDKTTIDLMRAPAALAAAREATNTDPTPAQAEAGNYAKGKIKIRGFTVALENPKGSTRRGTAKNGKKWEQKMHNDYGYILGSKAVDGDAVDVFLSENPDSGSIWVIDQMVDGKYDESKAMIGFETESDARHAYLSNYEKGWKGLGSITLMDEKKFKEWAGIGGGEQTVMAKDASILQILGIEKQASPTVVTIRRVMTAAGLPKDVRWFVNGERATAYYGDWHSEEVWNASEKAGRKLFKKWEAADDSEIGQPDWSKLDVNSDTKPEDSIHDCRHNICPSCGSTTNYCKDSTDGEHKPKAITHKMCGVCRNTSPDDPTLVPQKQAKLINHLIPTMRVEPSPELQAIIDGLPKIAKTPQSRVPIYSTNPDKGQIGYATFQEFVAGNISKEAKEMVRKTKLVEEHKDHCPHCDHEFQEKGYPRRKFNGESDEEWRATWDSGEYDEYCPACDQIVDTRELTDEEIDNTSFGHESIKEKMRARRETQRRRRAERTVTKQANTDYNSYLDSPKYFGRKGSVVNSQMLLQAATANQIDPRLLAAIVANESAWGTHPNAVKANNFGGVMGAGSELTKYPTPADGLNAVASNLHKRYISQGLTSPDLIGPKYAPTVGATNDPTGMNNRWVPTVSSIMNRIPEVPQQKAPAAAPTVTVSKPLPQLVMGRRMDASGVPNRAELLQAQATAPNKLGDFFRNNSASVSPKHLITPKP